MGMYLRSVVWNFVLTAIASISMCYVLLDGFYVDPSLQYSVIPAIGVLICLVILFFIGRRRSTVLIGGIVYAVFLVAVWVISAIMTPDGMIFVDFEENYLIYTMVIGLTATLCFLATRTPLGTAVLFIVGAFLLGLIQLFYERFELVWTILFVMAVLAQLIYLNYQRSVRTALSVEKVSFAPGFAVALIACLVSVGLAAGVWFGIIAPMNPEALDIKLITEYRALETVQVRGTSDEYQIPNIDMTSDDLNDGVRTTDDIYEDPSGDPWPATGEMNDEPEDQDNESSSMGMNLENFQEMFDLQNNPQNWPIIVLLALIIVLIVLYFILRRVRRNRRLKRFKELGPDREYEQAFLYLLGRFQRVGITVPPGQTMLEFAVSSRPAMRFHDAESGVAFADLAGCYSNMVYGDRPVDAVHVFRIEKFYKSFWKACRRQLGNFRYFFKSFRL